MKIPSLPAQLPAQLSAQLAAQSRLILSCVVALSAILPVHSAAWSDKARWFFEPHIGLAYEYVSADLKTQTLGSNAFIDYDNYLEDAYHGYNVSLGARIHNRIGFEISRFQSIEESVDAGRLNNMQGGIGCPAEVDSEFSGVNYDLMYFYRFKKKWEWMFSAGIADWDFDINVNPGNREACTSVQDGGDTFGRYGLGLQYHVSKRFVIRGLAHYLDTDWTGIDTPWSAQFGAQLRFR